MGIENLQPKIGNLKSNISFPAVALGAVGLLAGFMWMEHNAHLRSEGALKEIQKQTEAEVSTLRSQADSAARDANQNNARASSELQASRRLLQRQSQELGQKLDGLAAEEKSRVQQVAALPAAEIWKRLSSQLGPGGVTQAESGVSSQESGKGKSESRNQNGGIRGAVEASQSKIQNLKSQIPPSDSCLLTPEPCSLTEAGVRQVETALVELDSCREQSSVQSAQSSNCRKEAAAEAAMVEQQKSSIAQLNLALGDKDQILAKRETEFKAEIKAARGTLLARIERVVTHVAIGVAIGMAVR